MPRDVLALVNQVLAGRYVAEREVGRGAAARVFRAHDPGGRTVALKTLHPELLVSSVADRFLREIKVVGELDHPHIAKLLDSGSAEWLVYYVMEFIEGPTLREMLDQRGALPVAEARALVRDLLDALAHAHARGLVHRDVKPENVIVSPSAGAVLLDFGIARAVAATAGERLTMAGMTVGTAAYMSPEQVVAQEDLDQRSDIYSMGCILYECLTGQAPFAGLGDAMVMQRHALGPPPDMSRFPAEVPASARSVVERAMERRPDERWQTAGEMAQELSAAS